MQTMHTATEPSEKPVQDAGVNMNLFKGGERRPPALPPSMAGGDNANSNTETITMEFVVDPSVYRSANYQPTQKMLAALKKRGTKHKSQKTEEETAVDKKPTTAERDNGGNALSAIDIMIERLKREEQRPTPLNPHPKKWAYKKRPQRGVPKGGTEKPTIDESPGEGLQKHDERFHDGHYDGGECKYREDRGIPLEPTPPPTSSAQQSAASQPSASEVAREDTIAVGPTDESASVVSPTEAPTAVPSPAENSQAAQKTPQNAIAAPIPAVPPAQAQSASSPVESPEKVYEGIPKKKVVEYKRRMEKSRPYLDADQILSELSKIKDKKIQSDAFEWVLKGAVRLPEDLYKVQRAREMATKGKVDPLSYETPEACIADLYDSGMRDSVKPISVEELKQNPLMSNYRNHGYGIETFEVQDDEDGQALMRKVIDTHWGQDASPWCLLQGKDVYWASCFGDECGDEGGDPDVLDEDERAENRASAEKWWKRLGEQGRLDFLRQHNEPSAKDITKKLFRDEELQEFAKGKIWDAPYAAEYFAKNKIMPYDERFSGVSDDAWGYWERYSALPKRVAFKDGKLLAFMGTEGYDSVDEALRDFTSAELAGRLPMLYDEYISQVRNAIEEGDEETAEEVREKYGEDEDEWKEHFDEWMEDSNNWWGYEDEEEILRELTPEEWWDRQDSPHKGIPMGLTTLSDSEKKKLRDTIIKRAQMNGNSLSPDELEVGKGFSRDAELMPSGTVEWSGDYIRGRDGRPGYMRLDSRGQLKEDIQADGTKRRYDFDLIKGTYLRDSLSKSPDGTETTTEYFPGGEKKSETITAPGKTAEERNWDVEGRLIYEHANGRRRRWDGATGNLIQDVDAIGIGHEWTPDGVMTYEHLPNGDMMQWDSKGNKVFERKNTPGCLMSASWNPRQLGGGLDRIAKRYNDGTSEEWEWYPGGELKSYRGKDGKLKEWSSTGRQLEFSLGEHTDDKGNKAEWGAKTLRIDPSYMDLDASVTLADGNEALLRNETRPRVGGKGEKGHLYTKDGTISWFTGDRLDVLDVIGDYHGKKFFGAFTHDSLTPIAARCSENFPMEEARHWIGETWKAKERAQKFNEPDPYAKEHSLPQGKNAEMPEWVGFPKDEKNTDSLNAPKAPGAKEAAAIVGDEAPTKSALMMAFDELPEEGLQKHDERFHGGHYDGGECKYRTDRGIPTAEPTSNQKPQEESAEQIDDVDVLEVNAGGAESIEREDTLEEKAPAEAPTKAPVDEPVAEQPSAPPTWTAKLREAAERAARALRNFLPGVKVEFADRPRDEEAPVEEGTRLSVADIAKLSYKMNEQDVSLKSFANTFQTAIKGKDRTLEDAERIANDYLAAVKEAPEKFVPQLRPEKMTHMRYLFTSKGELYDPDNLQHVGMENDIPRQVYNLYKDALGEERFEQMQTLLKMGKEITPVGKAELAALEAAANESDTMQRALAENAERVNDERVKKVSELCQYFSGNDDYTATEKALIINGAMRYGISERMTENGLEVRLVSLADNNDAQVPVMGGEQTAKIVEHLRKGESYKNAVVAATKEMREIKAEKRGVPPNFTGWKVYGKDSSHEAAVELNNAVAGTGWCTGGAVSTAQMHRSGGDFHVYFRNGEPLIALRTDNGRLAEAPRGAHPGQFCTGEEEEIAEDYIRAGNGIVAGKEYLDDRADIRKVQSGQMTWQDALRIPKERRYENGEYGGDTKAWPEPMRKAIEKVIADHDEERKAAGWLTLDEAYEQPEKVKVIIGRAVLGWGPMRDMSFPNLEEVIGDLRLHSERQYEFPKLKRIGGYANFPKGASAPMLESIGGKADIENGSSIPLLTSIGDSATLKKGVFVPALVSIGGNAELRRGASAPALTSIGGNANLAQGASAPALTSVGGNAELYEGASAPALTSVVGGAILHAGVAAPALTSVGGYAILHESSSAPALESIGGDATLSPGVSVPALTSIGGIAILRERSSAPNLESIGGDAILREGASAPALESIGGDATLSPGVSVPALTSIGGDAILREGASAPNLERVGGEVTSYGNVYAPKLKLNHDKRKLRGSDGVVVGEYDRRTNKVTLYPGATPETVVHELAGHGAYQYAEQLAAKGNTTLLDRLNAIADNAPQSVKDEVSRNYSNASDAVKREELWTHVFAQRGAEALRKAQESKRGATWFKRMMRTARDVVRGIGSRVGLNRMDLSAIDNMSASETLDWLATQMAEGKTLGRIRREKATGDTAEGVRSALMSALDEAPAVAPKGGWEKHNKQFHDGKMPTPEHCKFLQEHGGASTPSASSETPEEVSDVDTVEVGNEEKPSSVVTAEEDAAYMDAVKRGDMETAQKMVREAAERAGFATEAYHGTKADFNQFNMVSDMNFGAHFGTKRAATDRTDMKSWETGDAHVGKYALRMANPLRLPDVFQSAGSLASYIFASRGEKDTGVYPNGKFHGEFDLAEGVFKDTPELDEVRAAYNAVFEGQPFKGKTGWEANPILMQAYLDYLRSLGYDSVVYKNKVEDAGEDSYLVMSSEQIKSADPVTYNDAGDVIPLSQRFNAASPDIRYAKSGKAEAGWSKRLRTMAQAAARMVERFMPGVKVRLSDAPYEGGGDRKMIDAYAEPPSEEELAEAQRQYDAVVAAFTNPDGTRKEGWMKAPNGASTNLDERLWVQVRTPNFKAWFGDWENDPANASLAVDENGEPRVVYHGGEIYNDKVYGGELYASSDKGVARGYGKVTPLFVNMRKPRIVEANGNPHDDIYGETLEDEDAYGVSTDRIVSDTMFNPDTEYDGVIFKDVDDRATETGAPWSDVYVPFNMNDSQAKRADGNLGTFKGSNPYLRYFKGDGGKVVGTYNRRTGEVVLYPGADKNTIAHELGGHATWQYAEQLAKEGNDKLLNKMNQVVDAAPRNIKDEVAENYGKEADAVQREEIWAHVMGHRGSAAIQKALESKRGRSWWGRFWDTAKEAWRGLASKVGLNRTSLDNIDQMSPDEFADYMAKEMVSGKVLGNIKYDKSDNSSSDDKRKQIVGTRGARKLGIGNQSDAQQMESDGASREDIWRKTGWWKGQDGQWRIEIADIPDVFKPLSKKEATRLKALKAAEKKEDAAVKDAIKKYKAARDSGNADEANKYADEAERHEAASLKHSQARYPLEARSKGWTEDILGNLLADHPLLKAYPWLSQTKVNRVSLPEGIGGHTDSRKNVITLSDTNTDAENHSALAHEIQHLIQSVEGFAQGADPDEVGMSEYLKHGGEVESRNVEKRLSMSPEERAATPPWETEDVAESEQIVSRD